MLVQLRAGQAQLRAGQANILATLNGREQKANVREPAAYEPFDYDTATTTEEMNELQTKLTDAQYRRRMV